MGPIGAGVLAVISLPIMTWIFPPAAIGKLSMLQVAVQLSVLLFCLGLDQAYVREYHESADKSALLLNTVLPGGVILLIALAVLMLIAPAALSRLLYGESSTVLASATVACLVVAYVSRFLSLILRMQERGLAYSMSQVLSKLLLLGIVLAYLLLPVSRTFLALLAAQAAALALTLTVFAWNTRRDWIPVLRARFDRKLSTKVLGFGWPLIFGGAASWGLAALDRIFLRSMVGYEQLAVYSVAASIASGVTVVAGIFNVVWAPLVYKWVADGVDMRRLNMIAHRASILVFLTICMAGGCSWILWFLLPPQYVKVPFIVVGCIAAPLLYTLSEITGIGISVSRKTRFSLVASFVAVLVNAALCYALVPRMGAAGAMTATACSFGLFFLLKTEFSSGIWYKLPRRSLYFYVGCSLLTALVYGTIGSRLPVIAQVVAWWLLLICVVWINRTTFMNLFCILLRQFHRTVEARSG